MSRIASQPVVIPNGVEVKFDEKQLTIKGKNGELKQLLNPEVDVVLEDGSLLISAKSEKKFSKSMAGTMRVLLSNMVHGVTQGFEKKLQLVGVGYRAQAQGKTLNLSLGFSHPVAYQAPEGITFDLPSQTEVIVKGSNKQMVGQVAADIRSFRPPEPYKGKGVRYADEYVKMKEAKKK